MSYQTLCDYVCNSLYPDSPTDRLLCASLCNSLFNCPMTPNNVFVLLNALSRGRNLDPSSSVYASMRQTLLIILLYVFGTLAIVLGILFFIIMRWQYALGLWIVVLVIFAAATYLTLSQVGAYLDSQSQTFMDSIRDAIDQNGTQAVTDYCQQTRAGLGTCSPPC